jgi:hypothetical protein
MAYRVGIFPEIYLRLIYGFYSIVLFYLRDKRLKKNFIWRVLCI